MNPYSAPPFPERRSHPPRAFEYRPVPPVIAIVVSAVSRISPSTAIVPASRTEPVADVRLLAKDGAAVARTGAACPGQARWSAGLRSSRGPWEDAPGARR